MLPVARFLWTAGYAGLVPVAPGTAGSVMGLVAVIMVRHLGPPWVELLALAGVCGVGVWASAMAERHYGRHDPGSVVIDEVAGMFVTLLWIPVGWGGAVAGFVAFRVFDIAKPFPARAAERLPGGWGVMADDIVAGVFAHLTVCVLAAVVPTMVLA